MRRWQFLVLKPEDDVATALGDVPAGEAAIRSGEQVEMLMLPAPIPLGHKIARHAIARGAVIRKYGALIGEATADIAAGTHVHVHNLRSRRARKT
ncbi:UxaA family hydrolase [Falsiroseomonas sp. E2-1-a4]|uniref:UxaA family hydrolase n=1 Tax=Falsiroseomonas sp. E2-1-a4 TaxID=3239299 RepID=UPI003F3AAE5D